jgi:hypothetical protein
MGEAEGGGEKGESPPLNPLPPREGRIDEEFNEF